MYSGSVGAQLTERTQWLIVVMEVMLGETVVVMVMTVNLLGDGTLYWAVNYGSGQGIKCW